MAVDQTDIFSFLFLQDFTYLDWMEVRLDFFYNLLNRDWKHCWIPQRWKELCMLCNIGHQTLAQWGRYRQELASCTTKGSWTLNSTARWSGADEAQSMSPSCCPFSTVSKYCSRNVQHSQFRKNRKDWKLKRGREEDKNPSKRKQASRATIHLMHTVVIPIRSHR